MPQIRISSIYEIFLTFVNQIMNNFSFFPSEPSPRRQPTQKRGKERVAKILMAAAEVFTEVGYSAATTQQIANRANTAIGSIYQFFPDKLAIFQDLEAAHCEKLKIIDQLIADADVQRPLSEVIGELLDGYWQFLADPISLCIISQLLQPHVPGLFAIFDPDTEQNLERHSISQLANIYQKRNPQLSRYKSELLSEVAHNAYRSVFFMALKRPQPEHRQAIFAELKDLLYAYLDPHIGDRFIDLSG
jgi:AcrR family transcriptional regulator